MGMNKPIRNLKDGKTLLKLRICKFKILSSIDYISPVIDDILLYIQKISHKPDQSIIFEVKVILNELILNAVRHGNREDANKFVKIAVGINDSGYMVLIVEDEGQGYNCRCLLSKQKTSLQETKDVCSMKETGRGMTIVLSLSEKIKFNGRGNRIIVLKKLY
ncbi:serine/threonine-protein kinase RsbW [Anaerobacterium chartisolvens]|uniref:Serine/threonine-protein kinase RsbW n=1 Tax=Anaerobacterium chartisolvens TaxID=1297424 RepID=A0A369B0K4_9FIRM|nr:ATP-binding protein [Anaerobacterium chartisolvens]RCX14865.1 serine/threonine-protein kinase RsbW [Anaerobacterium chartisolvens]